MSSQKQCHRARKMYADYKSIKAQKRELIDRINYLERRPPWWKPWEVKRWKMEADHGTD